MRHWHMGSWIDGTLARGLAASEHGELQGLHGPLVEAYGAYAFRMAHVKGDPLRWVCFWACEARHKTTE